MKKFKSIDLLDQLQSDVRQIIASAILLRSEDPGMLLEQPVPGKWTVIQVLEHLNTYSKYYFPAIERSLEQNKPAQEIFKPGWLGNYFTKMMEPSQEGQVKNKMKALKNHRPSAFLDPKVVLDTFIDQQQQLLNILALAKNKNIGKIRIPTTLSALIRLKLGDTFRFLVAHEQRHFIQVRNTLDMVKRSPSFLMAV